ncbi:MAG: protein kinase [Lentisphaerales bacterium]|nr:protein kinase [Lentisphaerales bacterium]
MTDDKRRDELSSLFDNALALGDGVALEHSDLLDKLSHCKERYKDLHFYKSGGSKVIYKAYDEMTGRTVALAQLRNESKSVQIDSFLREARLNALLQHPNIVPVYDVGLLDEQPFFCMKFIAGNSLEEILQDLDKKDEAMCQRFSLSDLIDIFLKICDAMAYAHSNGILHLDLKPENIRIDRFGDVLICDWGLSAVIDEMDEINDQFGSLEDYSLNKNDLQNMTIDGYIKGTPGYMAPEQTGQSSHRKSIATDTYALGAVLYSILTFRAPFAGSVEEILQKTAKGDFPPPSQVRTEVPTRLEAICLKAMKNQQEERYQSSEELQQDILAYRNGYLTTAEETTFIKLFTLFIKRNKIVSAVVTASLFLLFAFAIIFIHHLEQSRDEALAAKDQALSAKNEAINLAERLQKEKEENTKRGKILSAQFIKKYEKSFDDYEFSDALIFINSAVRLDPQNKQVWLAKAQLHCMRFQFKKSLAAYEKASKKDLLYELADQYRNAPEKIDTEFKIDIIGEFAKKNGFGFPTGTFVHWQIYSQMDIDERIKFAIGMLKIFNPNSPTIEFNFDKETAHLDISGNKEMIWAYVLQNFPAKSINLSNTPSYTFQIVGEIPLQELNAESTRVKKLDKLQTQNLRTLNIAKTKITNLDILSSSPLQTLDIRHLQISSLEPLRQMKFLRSLIVSPKQFSKERLTGLPKSIKIITRE